MKLILTGIFLTIICGTAFAATFSVRDTAQYFLGDSATQIIYTSPPQPFQPVYQWRIHTRLDGSPGIHSQDAVYIGDTDDVGMLRVYLDKIPISPVHCGFIIGERVAVGSPTNSQSNSLSFTILAGGMVGPLPPWLGECRLR